jgi:nitroreductase
MEVIMHPSLNAITQRRAIRLFGPVDIFASHRDELLHAARLAPSSFNIQPARLFWVASSGPLRTVAQLSFSQPPAETASALVVAVADIGAWRSTSHDQLEWMRASRFAADQIYMYERKSKFDKWFFVQGWCDFLGALKCLGFRAVNLFKVIGMPPFSLQGLFKWGTKSTSLACQNHMIAAESLGLNSSPWKASIPADCAVSSISPRANSKSSWSSPSARNLLSTSTSPNGAALSSLRRLSYDPC